jgi:lipopolysaccharide export system protein LptC
VQQPRQIGRPDGNRAFRSAARHSRLVRFLRFAIPAVILVIVAVIVAATFFRRVIKDAIPFDFGKIDFSSTEITIEAPRVKGFTTDQRPYELTAHAALTDLTRPDLMKLKEISAKVELKDGQRVNITGLKGEYNQKAEVLRLNDDITITSTSGYEGRLSEATVHVKSGDIVSESPVQVTLPTGVLHANRLEVKENGGFIRFSGGVEMTIKPKPAAAPDALPAPPEPLPAAAPLGAAAVPALPRRAGP